MEEEAEQDEDTQEKSLLDQGRLDMVLPGESPLSAMGREVLLPSVKTTQ